jgi:hypothetical protein
VAGVGVTGMIARSLIEEGLLLESLVWVFLLEEEFLDIGWSAEILTRKQF